jgi:predicted phosphodiesterase
MKILMVSDIHSDYGAAKSAYLVEKPNFVLDCGDHQNIFNLFEFTPHLYIYGNHEPKAVKVGGDDMPLPTNVAPGLIFNLSKDENEIRVAGIGGNYTAHKSPFSVTRKSLENLSYLGPNSLDILLLHESPLNVSAKADKLAEEMIKEIDRIRPKFVFSGHTGIYSENLTPGETKIVNLEDMHKGYGVVNFSDKNLNFERKRAYFTKSFEEY